MCANITNNITNILDWFNNEFLYLFEENREYSKEQSEYSKKDLAIFEEYNWDLI
jgi:hypothetical protein